VEIGEAAIHIDSAPQHREVDVRVQPEDVVVVRMRRESQAGLERTGPS
jgi:hypothetical protein